MSLLKEKYSPLSTSGENRGGQTGAGEQENDKQREVGNGWAWTEQMGRGEGNRAGMCGRGLANGHTQGGESQAGGGYFSPCSTHCFSINTGGKCTEGKQAYSNSGSLANIWEAKFLLLWKPLPKEKRSWCYSYFMCIWGRCIQYIILTKQWLPFCS